MEQPPFPFRSSEVETRVRGEREASASLGIVPRLRSGEPEQGEAAGRLLGIARHDRPRGPMETLERVDIGLATGVRGDFRGALKPGRNKRQVTVMALADWQAALDELGTFVPWEQRRVNLLVDGVHLFETTGARIVFEGGPVLEVTGECDPCSRMEDVAPGLKAVLLPRWRGGVCTRVIADGHIEIGTAVRIER